MKKILAAMLALVLIVGMGAVLAACGNNEAEAYYPDEEITEPVDVYVENDDARNDEPYDEPENDNEDNDDNDEPVDEPPDEELTNPFAPPENLGALGQAAQLEYFNAVVNRVRNERPGFEMREQLRIETENMTFTSRLISTIQPVVNSIVSRVMPGTPEYHTIARGANNQGYFMSLNPQASTLRSQDITSISSRREGNNWVMEVRVREETNPQHVTGQHARVSFIMDRDEVIEIITGAGPVSINPENVIVVIRNGVVRITVNAEGQIIAAERSANLRGDFTDARVAGIRTDGMIPQSSSWHYSNFVW
ncbi:MAG: hypothetical protein FWB76_01765 [Oscillospiraceae bacterium]|nr:hypothetical protein [Oscillospiraceae bacterium]